ncbi:hypothetical protein Glove_610g15 [Diversispora epigaea]|uniref:Uncharacterized protein n=1 Tax=Diversispora epigaea TaxID=1348612 RepID=A0A397G6L6_9GLOM|nr:hypothetical protein Glove_610g15 [Diversispora epigaea]
MYNFNTLKIEVDFRYLPTTYHTVHIPKLRLCDTCKLPLKNNNSTVRDEVTINDHLINQEWETQYTPRADIKPNIYEDLTKEFTIEEIEKYGEIPESWKKGNVALIPKLRNWEGNLEITRLIMLLETDWCRPYWKMESYQKMTEQGYLDIRRAFDSVDRNLMIKALQRLRIPEIVIKLIKNLISNHINFGITNMGLTKNYTVERGIDQEDNLSSLLLCIFYDPLLKAINDLNLKYTYGVEWHMIRVTQTVQEFLELTGIEKKNTSKGKRRGGSIFGGVDYERTRETTPTQPDQKHNKWSNQNNAS